MWYVHAMARKLSGWDSGWRADEVVVGDRGRLVLPAAVRAELGLAAGSRLLLSTESDGSLRLRPYRAVADAGRGLLAELGSGSMVDELVDERRASAAAEDVDGGSVDIAGE